MVQPQLYKTQDKMTSVIATDYRLLQVMSRFGIPLGFGDKTIEDVCKQAKVCPFTFITLLNYVKYKGEHVNVDVTKLNVKDLLNYLKFTHQYFLDFQFPKIRRNMLNAIDCSTNNEVAFLVLKFFDDYVDEVRKHMKYEEEITFTFVEGLLEDTIVDKHTKYDDIMLFKHHGTIEDKLRELKKLFVQYYPQTEIDNYINDVVFQLYYTQEDLTMHCMVEDNLFIPAVAYHEKVIKQKKIVEKNRDESLSREVEEELSEREKNVVVCVAKGMSNKEIADKLFLSVNTVTTHRRNIARKLSIHTSAGITIYAIVNKLVSLEEINI